MVYLGCEYIDNNIHDKYYMMKHHLKGDNMKELFESFLNLMKSEITLYLYLGILVLGVVLTIVGLLMYRSHKKINQGMVNKKYLILSMVGVFICCAQVIQIGIYLWMV